MRRVLSLTLLAACLVFAGQAHALTVTTSDSATDLADALLGSGATIVSASLTGTTDSQGTFSDGAASGLNMAEGVILTTGDATDAVGPNDNSGTGSDLGLGGSSALETLIAFETNDAVILDIVFTTSTGDLFFNYVFASEEYLEFVDSDFNDVFGFFLNGLEADDNIALIPGSSEPVTIDNVNDVDNSDLFNDNTNGVFDIEYDGFTDVFTASATGLTPGEEYTLSIQIGDASDSVLDSAVFLQGESFGGTPVNPIPEPASLLLSGIALAGLAAARRKFTG